MNNTEQRIVRTKPAPVQPLPKEEKLQLYKDINGLDDEEYGALEAFTSKAAMWELVDTKEERDQILAEYEHKYSIQDTRMIGGRKYVIAGWNRG